MLHCTRTQQTTNLAQIDESEGKTIASFSTDYDCTIFWGESKPKAGGSNPTRIELGDGSQSVKSLHLHPSGMLAIAIMTPPGASVVSQSRSKKASSSTAYLMLFGQSKAAAIDLQGNATSCAWVPPSPSERSRQGAAGAKTTALVGTAEGVIYTVTQAVGKSSAAPSAMQLHRLPPAMRLTGRSTAAPVAAISAHRHFHDESQLVVIVLTDDPVQIMQFAGGSTPEEVFAASKAAFAPMLRPGADRRVGTHLHVYTPSKEMSSKSLLTLLGSANSSPPPVLASKNGDPAPQHIAILTSGGLLYSRFDLTTPFQAVQYNFLRESKDLPYPAPNAKIGTYVGPVKRQEEALLPAAAGAGGSNTESSTEAHGGDAVIPLDVRLTTYHILYVFPSSIVAVNRVSFEVAWLWRATGTAPVKGGLASGSGIIRCAAPSGVPSGAAGPLLATEQCALRIDASKEGQSMWRIFMAQAEENEDALTQLQLANSFAKECADVSFVCCVRSC